MTSDQSCSVHPHFCLARLLLSACFFVFSIPLVFFLFDQGFCGRRLHRKHDRCSRKNTKSKRTNSFSSFPFVIPPPPSASPCRRHQIGCTPWPSPPRRWCTRCPPANSILILMCHIHVCTGHSGPFPQKKSVPRTHCTTINTCAQARKAPRRELPKGKQTRHSVAFRQAGRSSAGAHHVTLTLCVTGLVTWKGCNRPAALAVRCSHGEE